jgi:transposase
MAQHTIASIGIDVSKEKLDVAFVAHDHGATLQTYENTATGITELINDLKKQKTARTVPCVIESTGSVHFLVSLMLSQAQYTVKCINPLITKKYQRASIRNAKTDTVDAKRLAEIGLLEPHLRTYTATEKKLGVSKIIASLSKCEKLKQQLSAHLKQLKSTMDTLDVPMHYTNYEEALAALTLQIETLKETLCGYAPEEAIELAKNTKGISVEQTSTLLASLADKEFVSKDQLVAFIGLDVMPRRSGTWVGKQKLSKRGNAYLRKVLYQMAWGLKQHNDQYRTYYQKLRDKGHHYTTCLIAVARKFLRFLFAFFWQRSVSF